MVMIFMSNIYLIGFMGVGKSTAGKKLALKLGYNYIDTDKVFENQFKLGIETFFNKYGEELFRKLEHEVLESTFAYSNCVVSTGGGMPCYKDSMGKINSNGISVYLEMDEKSILNRLLASKQKRPLVKNLNENELLLFIQCKLSERRSYYEQANIIVPALSISIDSLASQLVDFNV